MSSVEYKSFDRVADVYDETRSMPEHAERELSAALFDILRATTDALLYEVGIGTGRITVPLARLGVRIVGSDIAPKMLAVLRSKHASIDACLAESARPPFRAGTFDAVLFAHILHLVPDVDATVRASIGLLKPSGLVISGTDRSREGVRERGDEAIQRVAKAVAGIEMTSWKPYAGALTTLDQFLREWQATPAGESTIRWTAQTTGRRHLERLARRDFSSAWMIPDDALPAVVAAATPVLEELYGGLDTTVEFERSFAVRAWRLLN
jgi:ubiquinone/menaquinone biosynthesis C-methylase UbiE